MRRWRSALAIGLVLAGPTVAQTEPQVHHEPIRSDKICAELDLRVMPNNADAASIEAMRQDFERFITEAINRCTKQRVS